MNTITVLLVTMWLSQPGVQGLAGSSKAIIAPSAEACEADKASVIADIRRRGVSYGKLKLKIEAISDICLTFEPPHAV